jgi:hypothetical protein
MPPAGGYEVQCIEAGESKRLLVCPIDLHHQGDRLTL